MIECDSFCGHYYREGGCNPTCVYIPINYIYIWISLLQLDYLSTCWYNAFITWVKSSPRWHSFTCCVGKLRYGINWWIILCSLEASIRNAEGDPKKWEVLMMISILCNLMTFFYVILWYWIYFAFDEMYLVSRNFMCQTHSIHETGIFTHLP